MAAYSPPEFKKRNQHYVPRFWIKNFAGSDGRIFGRRRGEAQAVQVAAGNVMTNDWTYTVFDAWWRPSDELENALSVHEREAADAISMVREAATPLDSTLRLRLCKVIAVAACRLPHSMRRGHKRIKELATAISQAKDWDNGDTFLNDIEQKFGVRYTKEVYDYLKLASPELLVGTVQKLAGLSPQDPLLSEQEALKGAGPVADLLATLDFTVHDAPPESLILGDTPLPDSDLIGGFILPLSERLALSARPAKGISPTFDRMGASPEVISSCNRFQFDSFVEIAVGPTKALLESL